MVENFCWIAIEKEGRKREIVSEEERGMDFTAGKEEG